MKKRLFAVLLALVMVLALLPTAALAADKVEINWLPGGMEPLGYDAKTDRILARNGTAWFLLDRAGNIVKPLGTLDYEYMGGFSEGLAYVSKDGKCGYIDGSGQMVIPASFDDAYEFSEGLAAVGFGDWNTCKYGFIDQAGQMVIQPVYDDVNFTGFSEGLAAVKKGELWGFIDKTGKEVIPPAYDYVYSFSEGLAMVRVGDYENEKCGFIDKTGKIVLPLEYDDFNGAFSEGLTWMRKGDKSGYIDKTGKMVIPCNTADFFGRFSEGIAGVQDEKGTYYIDKTGKVLFRTDGFWGQIISTFECGLAAMERFQDVEPGYWDRTFINKNGEEIFSEYYNLTLLWGPCGYVCKFVPGDEDGISESYGIFVNPYYTSTQPEQPTTPDKPATPTNDKLSVDGRDATPAAYKIGGANYFKLRDVAMMLSGTKAQFSIAYDGEKKAIMITTGQPYQPVGGELGAAPSAVASAMTSNDAVYINGEKVNLTAYKIDNANYYGIRELAQKLGFNVGWTGERGMFIESDKPYTDAD